MFSAPCNEEATLFSLTGGDWLLPSLLDRRGHPLAKGAFFFFERESIRSFVEERRLGPIPVPCDREASFFAFQQKEVLPSLSREETFLFLFKEAILPSLKGGNWLLPALLERRGHPLPKGAFLCFCREGEQPFLH